MTYTFSDDWFSANIPTFARFLTPLAGAPISALEIGSYEGRSAVWLFENILKHPASRLTAIDAYPNERLLPNVRAAGAGERIEFFGEPSRQALRKLPFGSYDFIYIDGSHATTDVMEDAVLAWPLAKVGAIIAFDDYRWNDPKYNQQGVPKPAINAFLKVYKKKIEVLHKKAQVWIRKLRE